MADEAEDPQKTKKTAAAAYAYDNDQRWTSYWSNVLIPPHLSSRPDVKLHFQRKFYQRYIDPDLEVEPMSMTSRSQSAKSPTRTQSSSSSTPADQRRSYSSSKSISQSARSPPQTQSSSSSTPAEQPRRSYSSSYANRTAGSSTTESSAPTSLRWDRKTIHFSVNAWAFVVGVFAIFPLAPRNLSDRAYRLSLMGTACSSLYSVYSLYGKPRAWDLQGVQVWFQSVIVTKEFMYLIYCLTFVTSHLYLKFALIPILCRALQYVAKFLGRNFSRSDLYRKYLDDTCVWVESNTTTLSILSSQAEIGLGFLLILSLFSWQRNIIQAFLYWQLLKLMYHAPATAANHQSVWTKIDGSCDPLVQRYAMFLNTPISAVKRWWIR